VILPKNDAEFVANMEEVIEIYEKPHNAANPVVCMDEQPVQLIKETRQPIPAAENHPRRVDYEYERDGTACVLMFTEPLSGWPAAEPRRTGQLRQPAYLRDVMQTAGRQHWSVIT